MAADLFETFGVEPPQPGARPIRDTSDSGGRDLFVELGGTSARENPDSVLSNIKGAFRLFWSDVRGQRSVMEDYQPAGPVVRPEDRPSPVAPLRDDTYQALDAAVKHMDAETRGRLAARPGVTGVAVRRVLKDMDERSGRLLTPMESIRQGPLPGDVRASEYQGFGKEGADRLWSDYSAGVVGSTGATLGYAGRKLRIGALQELGDAMVNYSERITPSKQTFADRVVNGVGSMASFYVPGLGVARGTQALALLSPTLAKWTGAGTMAALEAAGEADSIYKTNIRAGLPEAEAAARADHGFLANLALLGVTDRFGLFNDIKGLARRVGTAAVVEGPGQEAPQQVISNYLTDRPLGEGVGESAAIGAIVGGGARAVQTAGERAGAAAVGVDKPATLEARQIAPGAFEVPQASAEPAEAPARANQAPTPAETVPGAGSPISEVAPVDAARIAQPPTQTVAPAAAGHDARLEETDTGSPVDDEPGRDLFAELGVIAPAEQAAAPADVAAHEAATSPLNDLPGPTEAQARAGNYRKGHTVIGGLDVSIENPAGSHRRPEWPMLEAHYGYVKGVAAKAGDRDYVDVFVKPGTADDYDGPVYAIDQNKKNGVYDEVKVMIGFGSQEEATAAYLRNYEPGWASRIRGVTPISMDDFKARLADQNGFSKPLVNAGARKAPSASVERPRLAAGKPISTARGGGGDIAERPVAARRPIAALGVRAPQAVPALLAARGVKGSAPAPDTAKATHGSVPGGRAKVDGLSDAVSRLPASDEPRAGSVLQEPPESNTLAATGVVMTPPYAAAGGQVDDASQARPDAIRQAIRRLFNVPINEGRFKRSRDTLGIYKIKPRTIRVKNQNDIGVIAHETGHHFSETSRPVRVLMKTHEKELRAITPYAAQQKTPRLQREEGFAEYLRLAWTQPQQARALAPGFHAAFAQYVDKNGHRKAFDAIEGAIRDWENLPPADRILAKVGRVAERASRQELTDRFIFEVLDRWVPLKNMVADLKLGIAASKDPFKLAHLLAGDAAVIEDWITTHTIPFDLTRRADPKNYGKSLRDILKPVAKQLNEFKAYAIAVRAGELLKAGKEHLFTKEEIAAGLKLETPAFKKAADELVAFNESLIDYAEEGGLLSPVIATRLRATGAYTVPFFRESEEGSRHGGGTNPFKRIFGGTENLRDPIANLVQNTANIVYATNRNAVLVKARELAREVPGGGRWIEDIPVPDKVLHVPTRAILESFKQQGVTIDQQTAAALAHIQKLIVPNPVEDPAERIVIARVNGEPKALQVNNKLLFKALQSFEAIDLGIVEKVLSVPSDLLRAGVTLSPEFMARNFMRDTLSGFMQSKPGILPVVGTLGGFKEVATHSDAAKLFRAFGGAYADMWHGESAQAAKILERMAKRGRFDPRTILTPGGVLRALKALGSVSEAGTRVAEFKKTAQAKPGDVESLIEAAYNAREVSVDFGMHGANPAVRMLTRITPFLNPAMQGLYKAARSGRERFALTLLRGSFLTAFSIGLFMLNRGQDWYDDLEKWERNVYWHFDVGLRSEDGDVVPLRLPKPFEWGAVFGSIPEALTQYAIEQHGNDFAKRLASIWKDVFALRAVPTALLVPAELWANKNTFTDRPIVPESKERLDPELQHGNYASITARELGALTDSSPAKIDHLIRGFFGTIGVYAVQLADLTARQVGDYPPLPPMTWRQMPLVKAFVHDPDNPNTRYLTEFYELLKEARQRDASLQRVYDGTDKAEAYGEKHGKLLDVVGDANRTARSLSALRRDSDELLRSREYTGGEKRDLINENDRTIKREAKDFMLEAARQGVKQ